MKLDDDLVLSGSRFIDLHLPEILKAESFNLVSSHLVPPALKFSTTKKRVNANAFTRDHDLLRPSSVLRPNRKAYSSPLHPTQAERAFAAYRHIRPPTSD